METLDFTFKKNRKLGALISDYIDLFKKIFKHFNKNILTVSLPFIALFMLLVFYSISAFVPLFYGTSELTFLSIIGMVFTFSIFFLIFMVLISIFGMEYMFLLEERQKTDFTYSDVLTRVKKNFKHYFFFFLATILVNMVAMIPIGIISFILVFIPLVGSLAMGVLMTTYLLFIYCALFLYLQKRETLWDSYGASFRLIKSKMFEYGAAAYLFQFMVQIILGILVVLPTLIIFVITFFTVDFSQDFFITFTGKFLASIGGAIMLFAMIFSSIYMISFYVLEYFSLLEINFGEETLEDIEQIGATTDEF